MKTFFLSILVLCLSSTAFAFDPYYEPEFPSSYPHYGQQAMVEGPVTEAWADCLGAYESSQDQVSYTDTAFYALVDGLDSMVQQGFDDQDAIDAAYDVIFAAIAALESGDPSLQDRQEYIGSSTAWGLCFTPFEIGMTYNPLNWSDDLNEAIAEFTTLEYACESVEADTLAIAEDCETGLLALELAFVNWQANQE